MISYDADHMHDVNSVNLLAISRWGRARVSGYAVAKSRDVAQSYNVFISRILLSNICK